MIVINQHIFENYFNFSLYYITCTLHSSHMVFFLLKKKNKKNKF